MSAVRRLGPDDWPVLRAVRLAALADSPEAFASTLDEERALTERAWRGRLDSAATFLGAGPDGAPCGLVTGLPVSGGEVHLVGMWVGAAARGSGIAARLVGALADWARGQGADGIVLWVVSANERARRFYTRMGFGPTGESQLMPEKPTVPEERWRLAL